ncbi:MAG: helix-turn-helix transcriptional regulator [Clostridiales bacterium]|nr:helix-turn-helix transcriptional regulator [Clostridiales bacterium]
MPIKYKFDILPALKAAGYNTSRLRREKLLAESTIQALRTGKMISLDNISRICAMLNCQPGDILEYEPEEGQKEKPPEGT